MISGDYKPEFMYEEIVNTFCGELLGSGAYRHVFEMRFDETRVVKIDQNFNSFSNVHEMEIWRDLQHTKMARWLAPCHFLSPCGRILIQERTQKIRPEELPDRVPAWMTDTKPDNFGMLEGRVVAHDYALNLLVHKGSSSRMKKAEWF